MIRPVANDKLMADAQFLRLQRHRLQLRRRSRRTGRCPGLAGTGIDASHAAFDHSNLFEGNWANNLGKRLTHGNDATTCTCELCQRQQLLPVHADHDPRTSTRSAPSATTPANAFLGNVLGKDVGPRDRLPMKGTPSAQSGTPITYELAFAAGNIGWDDGYSANEILIDGNKNFFHSSQQWPNGTVSTILLLLLSHPRRFPTSAALHLAPEGCRDRLPAPGAWGPSASLCDSGNRAPADAYYHAKADAHADEHPDPVAHASFVANADPESDAYCILRRRLPRRP